MYIVSHNLYVIHVKEGRSEYVVFIDNRSLYRSFNRYIYNGGADKFKRLINKWKVYSLFIYVNSLYDYTTKFAHIYVV